MKLKLLLILIFYNIGIATYAKEHKPNFIIIFTDDQGYEDLGCYGSPKIKTPRIDQMAAEGMKFTDFYAQTVCGPSRAAIMTGCYPFRIKRDDSYVSPHPRVSLSEVMLPEILQPLGYKTGMIGKWDLAGHSQKGFTPELSPMFQGFDYTYWTPSSNDSSVDLYEGSVLLEEKTDMSTLTERYTDQALHFMTTHRESPFFLYLAHTMPHVRLAVSEKFKGKSAGGIYGDVIEEIDFHTGRILDKLKELDIDKNTYVVFTSDNGHWWICGPKGGNGGPLRGAKTGTYDGGLRVPCIVRAPGRIPAGTACNLVTSTIDLLPTFTSLAGGTLPANRVIDGHDLSHVLDGSQTTLDRTFFYYQHKALRAVRKGDWKLFLPHSKKDRTREGDTWRKHLAEADRAYIEELTLYNLKQDIGETTNVAKENPEVVADLLTDLAFAKKDLGYQDHIGENARR